jgi:glucose/mannose-6-phosphate isomerase
MEEIISQFPNQIIDALNLVKKTKLKVTSKSSIQKIVFAGLGGSGIAGSIIQNHIYKVSSTPFIVCKEYSLPKFVDNNTLVIVCSYSGNTEETINAYNQAIKSKATIVCITSGGTIKEMALKYGHELIELPLNFPPRASLAYGTAAVLHILTTIKCIPASSKTDYLKSSDFLNKNQKKIQKKATELAKKLFNKLPIIYSSNNYEGASIRFKQQLNENAKILAYQNVIPEMNHNELVGWTEKHPDKSVIFVKDSNDFDRTQFRMDINKKLIKSYASEVIDLKVEGENFWEKTMYFIHLTDFVSTEIAKLKGIDATEVKVIDHLKNALSKA